MKQKSKASILVIEGDRFYVDFYHEVLGREGYRVEVARSIAEAQRCLDRENFDLAISDLVIKKDSGLELLAGLKRDHPQMDVIMVTSMQSIRRAVEALKMGAADYLTKPVNAEELLLSIRKLLDQQVKASEHTRLVSENIHFFELLRIQRANMHILSLLGPDELGGAVLEALMRELEAPGGILFRKGNEEGLYRAAASRGILKPEEEMPLVFRTPFLQESLESGAVLTMSPDGDQAVAAGDEEADSLILPIRSKEEVFGAVRLAPRRGGRAYGAYDVEVAKSILETAGMAFKNSQAVSESLDRSITGPVSGTYAPAYFKALAETYLGIARRYNREAALVLVSLDNYRAVKAALKERQAAKVVEDLCATLLELIRETDILARLSEDLFGILVPETDFYGALMLEKRIKGKLSQTTYPLDLKRDLVPIVSLGSAAAPKDGTHVDALMAKARRQLEQEHANVCRQLDLGAGDFWSLVFKLLDPLTAEGLERKDPAKAPVLRSILTTEERVRLLAVSLTRDLETFCTSRGLLYLCMGPVDPERSPFRDTNPGDRFKISVFALGPKGKNLWNLSHITPVFIRDEELDRHLFFLTVTEDISYGLFCRLGDDETIRGFHTSDRSLVLELMTRLQDQYLLQRRIG